MTPIPERPPRRGRMSRIQRLPDPIRDRLHALLRGGVAQADILARLAPLLAEAGEQPISRSGLSRYATRLEAAGRRLREMREISDAWVARWGEQPSGDIGRHVIEILRGIAMDLAARASDADPDDDAVGRLGELALAVQRLERAAGISDQRARAIRAEARAEAAQTAEQTAAAQGLSAEGAAAIRAAIEAGA